MSDKLKILIEQYNQQLPNKITMITQEWDKVKMAAWNENDWEQLCRNVHSLGGASGTYGHKQLSKDLLAIELALQPCVQKAPSSVQIDHISYLFNSLNGMQS